MLPVCGPWASRWTGKRSPSLPVSGGMPKKKRPRIRGGKVQPIGYCATQRKYSFTEEQAKELLSRPKGQGKGGKVETRAYKCPWGDHWHLTSKASADT